MVRSMIFFFFFQAEDGIRDPLVTGVQTCALPILGLAIDDFGTGYSSLSRVKDLPVDILKIDRPFLRGVPEDQAASATVRAIVQLADGLGMRPLAEGVEMDEQ